MPRVTKLVFFLSMLATQLSAAGTEEGHGVSATAEALFHVGPLPVTNSMVTSWVVALILVIAVRFAVKRPSLIPTRGQAFVEHLVEGVLELITPIVGKKVA